MKHFISGVLLTAMMLLFAQNAFAAWSFDITTDYVAGDDQVVFSLNLTTDEEVSILSYAFEFEFDAAELSYVSYSNSPVSGLIPQFLGAFSDGSGTLDNFHALAFVPATVAAGDYVIGTFTFNVADDAVFDGTTDLNFDYDDIMFAFTMDSVNYTGSQDGIQTMVISHFTDVGSAVPVPGTMLLLGAGLLGLSAVRRRQA